MKTNLILLLLTFSLGGCVTARVEESRSATTGLGGRASYNDRETEKSFTDCLADVLGGGDEPIKMVPQEDFKDNLYPWFEPRTAPSSSDELAQLFARPGVADQIQASNVRYLAWIDGDTITVDKGGSFSCTISTFGGGCFGMSYWEEDASYEASIWDLDNLTTAGAISADANGTSYLAGLVVPVPIMARPGNAACKALASQLRDFLTGDI